MLDRAVRTSFGPQPREKLLVSATNKVLLTSSGASILASLVSTHPVARWVLDVIAAHSRHVGDGSTAFVLLLCGALEEANKLLRQQNSLQRQRLACAVDWLRQARAQA